MSIEGGGWFLLKNALTQKPRTISALCSLNGLSASDNDPQTSSYSIRSSSTKRGRINADKEEQPEIPIVTKDAWEDRRGQGRSLRWSRETA